MVDIFDGRVTIRNIEWCSLGIYICRLKLMAVMIDRTFAEHDADCPFHGTILSHQRVSGEAGVLLLLSRVQKHF